MFAIECPQCPQPQTTKVVRFAPIQTNANSHVQVPRATPNANSANTIPVKKRILKKKLKKARGAPTSSSSEDPDDDMSGYDGFFGNLNYYKYLTLLSFGKEGESTNACIKRLSSSQPQAQAS